MVLQASLLKNTTMQKLEPRKKFTIEWLRSFPKLASLSDIDAQNVLKTLTLLSALTAEYFKKKYGA